jgi:hypothetical protein
MTCHDVLMSAGYSGPRETSLRIDPLSRAGFRNMQSPSLASWEESNRELSVAMVPQRQALPKRAVLTTALEVNISEFCFT